MEQWTHRSSEIMVSFKCKQLNANHHSFPSLPETIDIMILRYYDITEIWIIEQWL